MNTSNENIYRNRFLTKYSNLFYQAWKIHRFNPAQGLFWLKTLKRQKKMLFRRRKAESDGLVIPPVLIFSITNQCNLRCKGCYAKVHKRHDHSQLPQERVSSLFREASDLGIGVIMIAGGEPLMRMEVIEQAANHPDIIFPVFTNGLLLQGARSELFKNHRNMIPVLSIEGNRQFTDTRRGTGIFHMLERIMNELQNQQQMYGLSITLTRRNFEEVIQESWMRRLYEKGCRLFFLVEYVPGSEQELSLCLTETHKATLQEHLEDFRNTFPALFISLPGDEEKYGGCLAAGRGFIHVSADGNLEPCPFAPYTDTNIRNRSLKEGLRSVFLRKIRDSHHLLSEAEGGCTLWENREWVKSQLKATLSEIA